MRKTAKTTLLIECLKKLQKLQVEIAESQFDVFIHLDISITEVSLYASFCAGDTEDIAHLTLSIYDSEECINSFFDDYICLIHTKLAVAADFGLDPEYIEYIIRLKDIA